MNKIKDILYDKNDILVALLIVAVAAFVIYTRIEVIMDYPEIQADAAQSSSQSEEQDKTANQTDGKDTQQEKDSDETKIPNEEGTEPGSGEQTQAPSGIVSINVPSGSTLDSISQQLLDNGLISDKTAFINHMVSQGLDTKVKAGTFQIPGGSSADEIAAILTK